MGRENLGDGVHRDPDRGRARAVGERDRHAGTQVGEAGRRPVAHQRLEIAQGAAQLLDGTSSMARMPRCENLRSKRARWRNVWRCDTWASRTARISSRIARMSADERRARGAAPWPGVGAAGDAHGARRSRADGRLSSASKASRAQRDREDRAEESVEQGRHARTPFARTIYRPSPRLLRGVTSAYESGVRRPVRKRQRQPGTCCTCRGRADGRRACRRRLEIGLAARHTYIFELDIMGLTPGSAPAGPRRTRPASDAASGPRWRPRWPCRQRVRPAWKPWMLWNWKREDGWPRRS